MARTATTLLVLGLLAGTAVAFAVSEGLKLEKTPITATKVDKVFSPVCGCPMRRARIAFRLRKADRLTISMVDSEGRRIRTLVDGRRFGRGLHHFTWNGRDDGGRLVLEGKYRPKVELSGADRTIVLPNPIRVDVTRPRVVLVGVRPRVLSPDGDGRGDVARVRYRVSERAHALLLVNGRQRVRGRWQRPRGELSWYGRAGGRPLPPGRYRLEIVAEDLAGNLSRPVSAGLVRIRYVELSQRVVRARAGARIAVGVSADAPRLLWSLRRGSSTVARGSAGKAIVLRAPRRPGRYLLVVEAAGHRARAAVVVRRPAR